MVGAVVAQAVGVRTVMDEKWAVAYYGIYEYESEEEARRQYALASWDVPAQLVKSTDGGKTWIIVL